METHALVKWCSSKKMLINQVKTSDICYDKSLGLIEEEIYSVKWSDNKKYRAQLIFLGKNKDANKIKIKIFHYKETKRIVHHN